MDTLHPKAVIGTNSWGSAAYGKALRGSSVAETVIAEAVEEALEQDLLLFDTARDYGLGKGQPMLGRLCPSEVRISSKFTPGGGYEPGQVRASFEKDLADFGRDSVEIYWLHLPNHIEENLSEMIDLYRDGKIRQIGVSNFNLAECRQAKMILDHAGIPLYGVQNHFSLLNRTWEKNGLLDWCRENQVSFWAWAVLEEGILIPPKPGEAATVMKLIFRKSRKKLGPLYRAMSAIGGHYGLNAPQTAMAYCTSKGAVPVCGCRRPEQVRQLSEAASVRLSTEDVIQLEAFAEMCGARVLGADMFRFAVRG